MKKNPVFTLSNADPWSVGAEASVLFVWESQKPDLPADKNAATALRRWIDRKRFAGKALETGLVPLPPAKDRPAHVLLCGLGKLSEFTPTVLDRAASTIARAAIKHALGSLSVPSLPRGASLAPDAALLLLARGMRFGAYEFQEYKSSPSTREALRVTFGGCPPKNATLRKALQRAEVESEAIAEVRDFANQPGNVANPAAVARFARQLAKQYGLDCEVLDDNALRRKGCRAFLAVSAGSHTRPALVTLKTRGARKGQRPLVVIGKTITFDAGGISLKPSKSMEWMRYDKCGGMTVLALMIVAARLKFRRPVVGMLAAAENMPGGGATRPGDIVRTASGKTVEILNTDAEGRLVLADTLTLAAALKPAAMVDLATLTGAVLLALGHEAAAVLANNEDLSKELIAAGQSTGDRLWPLPLWRDYASELHTPFADLRNIGAAGSAGVITGAWFLREFVSDDIPWAHLDISGTAWTEKPGAWAPPGATLFGTKLLSEWIHQRETTP